MDLEISGRQALVCASSRGLGRACAEALLAEGVRVVISGRDGSRLAKAHSQMSARWPEQVVAVCGDVTTPSGRAALLKACPDPDILVTNNAGPAAGSFAELDEMRWIEALRANMVAPLMLIRAVIDGMRTRRFGRIVNITSAMVTTPRPGLALSSGARAGLTAGLKGMMTEAAVDNVTINNLLPERFDTDRQKQTAKAAMKRDGISHVEARARQIAPIPAGRLGRPQEFGAACAFVCSAHAGYMTGMNIRLDGGSYPALL